MNKVDPRTEPERLNKDEERHSEEEATAERPAAGPHAKPDLTNKDATPGAGVLPDPEDPAAAPDSTSS